MYDLFMRKRVTKAVIPAAGFGTRFLPQTKAMPKEMLPIVDRPVIQYVVDELVEAGISDIFIVTGYHKRSIEDHFDAPSSELEDILRAGGAKKAGLLAEVERIGNMANFVYVRQKGPYGNGTPLLNVRHLLSDEAFLYIWGDDFIKATPSRVRQLLDVYEKYGTSVLSALRAKSDEDYDRYGVSAGEFIEEGIMDIKTIVEKPGKENAPSDMLNVCAGLFTPDIFEFLDAASEKRKPEDELYYNDALKLMLLAGKRILAKEIVGGKYYDTGNKLEYLKTVVEFGLEHPEIGEEFREYLNKRV